MYQYVLFDLDGTLTDSKIGITRSVQYALKAFGIEEPDLDKLEPFIGPPLADSFREFYGIDGEDCVRAVAKFRERFEVTGITENEIYPGIFELVHELHKRGICLAIASSKPQEFVHIVLKNFGIEECFSVIVGSERDGRRDTKTAVMEEALSQLKKRAGRGFDKTKVLMVGDRKFDIEGARHFGVDSVAVTYGYAPDGELTAANPTWICDSVQQLEEVITGEKAYLKYRDIGSLKKTLEILMPLFIYWLVELLVFNVLYLVIRRLFEIPQTQVQQMTVFLNAVAAIATWPYLSKTYETDRRKDTSHVITRRRRKRLKKEVVLLIAYAVSMAIGLNVLIAFFKITSMSGTYQQVASKQYSVALPVGLVIYGILTPFTEELLFRGVLYNRMKKYFPVPIAIMLCGIVFGCYHGNLVQIIYATLMGLAMALVYEYYGMLLAPVLFHCSANCLVYILSKSSAFGFEMGRMLYAIILLAVALGITCWYVNSLRSKNRIR